MTKVGEVFGWTVGVDRRKRPGWLAAEGEERAVGWPGIFHLR
jgi:hypothetical protein